MRPNAEGARAALARFGITPERIEPLTTGHINETWHVAEEAGEWLLQWLNHGVFPEAKAVQANMEVALAHLAAGEGRRSVTPVLRPAADGALSLETDTGLWRVFAWLPDRVVRMRPCSAEEAEAAGNALGAVLAELSSLDTGTLPRRMQARCACCMAIPSSPTSSCPSARGVHRPSSTGTR